MSDDEFTLWRTESGLYDDVDVEIQDAFFEWDGEYDRLLLKLEITTDDEDHAEDTLNLSTGKGWEAAEKGASARREDGKDKLFHGLTGAGMWVDAMVEAGALDELNTPDRKDPRKAKSWVGLRFHCERKTIKGGEGFNDRSVLLPVKFLGVKGSGDSGSSGSGGGKAKATKAKGGATEAVDAPPADADEAAGASTQALGGKLKVQLIKLAKEHDDHDDFLLAAYELDGVDGNPAAEAAIESPDDGIWADVHG